MCITQPTIALDLNQFQLLAGDNWSWKEKIWLTPKNIHLYDTVSA